jgi:hypothetical protein
MVRAREACNAEEKACSVLVSVFTMQRNPGG